MTIKNSDKTSKAVPFTITYPYMLNPPSVSYTLRTNNTFSDKQLAALNTQISSPIKEIPLTGAKGISEESVSIYNDLGIKANGLVDHQKAYTIELAVPLNILNRLLLLTANLIIGCKLMAWTQAEKTALLW